jgi:FKBP-type peptidyl-prolyl cis-trans isomerase FklB
MKVRLILLAAVVLFASHAQAQEKGGRRGELKSVRDRASYSFGMSMGNNFKRQGVDFDFDLVIQGLRDATTGGKLQLTDDQAMEAMQAFEKEIAAKQAADSKKFLVDNKKRAGVKTTPSGLQYKVLKTGKGNKPKADDVVSVNYRASLVNGVEFEASPPDKPFVTPVNQVIPGWEEALQMMETGSRWQLFIPPDLAYGEQGSPPAIGPNTTLVFDLELVEINKPTKPGKPAAGGGNGGNGGKKTPPIE